VQWSDSYVNILYVIGGMASEFSTGTLRPNLQSRPANTIILGPLIIIIIIIILLYYSYYIDYFIVPTIIYSTFS